MPSKKNNDDNINFYEKIDVSAFAEMANKGGFDDYSDLEIAYEYFKNSKKVLEIGAGYGRCIDFLIQKGYSGKIWAVEYSKSLYDYLIKKYQNKEIQILHQDIKTFDFTHKIDTALWMWSGFIDFTETEQELCVQRLYSRLEDNGLLIIDVPRFGIQTIANHSDAQNIHYETSYGSIDCFIPNSANMQNYATNAGFKSVQNIEYETNKNKGRSMYIFQK
ncbi:MAG: class I SAM-dependent methyltransferase [Cytophagales bacterium]|nr:MAG: class I SAM-dependent methyltransferase [Cytophagales bacterium]